MKAISGKRVYKLLEERSWSHPRTTSLHYIYPFLIVPILTESDERSPSRGVEGDGHAVRSRGPEDPERMSWFER
jgi:hypothetical protein